MNNPKVTNAVLGTRMLILHTCADSLLLLQNGLQKLYKKGDLAKCLMVSAALTAL